MEIPFPMMYNMSLIIKLRSRNQFPNLQTDMAMTQFFSQWEWDLNTSDVDIPWWVLSIVTLFCDLNLECSKFQGQMCN